MNDRFVSSELGEWSDGYVKLEIGGIIIGTFRGVEGLGYHIESAALKDDDERVPRESANSDLVLKRGYFETAESARWFRRWCLAAAEGNAGARSGCVALCMHGEDVERWGFSDALPVHSSNVPPSMPWQMNLADTDTHVGKSGEPIGLSIQIRRLFPPKMYKFLNIMHLIKVCNRETCQRMDVANAACEMLIEGHDTPNLRILAGYGQHEVAREPYQFDVCLEETLSELEITLSPVDECLLDLLPIILQEIVDPTTLISGGAEDSVYLIITTFYDKIMETAPRVIRDAFHGKSLGSAMGMVELFGAYYSLDEIRDYPEADWHGGPEEAYSTILSESNRLLKERPWVHFLPIG